MAVFTSFHPVSHTVSMSWSRDIHGLIPRSSRRRRDLEHFLDAALGLSPQQGADTEGSLSGSGHQFMAMCHVMFFFFLSMLDIQFQSISSD